jgi:archaellum biogenesis ATPase FlaH
MSVGINLLLAILKEKSRSRLLEIPSDFLRTDQETKLYAFIRRHLTQHDKFPALATVRKRFGISGLPKEPSSFYHDEAARRAFYNLVREPYAKLGESFQGAESDIDAMLGLIDQLSSVRRRFMPEVGGVDDSTNLLDQVLQEFEDASTYHGLRGVTTGWDEVDEVTGGYQPSDLVIWVGRPGRGKSWLLLQQCYSAWKADNRVLYISMEMEGKQSMRRMVGLHSRINPNLIRTGTVSTQSQPLVRRAIEEMKEINPLYMVTANFERTVTQVASYIEKYDPDIIYLDATYLLQPEKKRYGSSGRREAISDVIEEIKKLAADCKRPIIGTVQFNRNAEQRRRSRTQDSEGSRERINPVAHLGLDVIGETDVISQSASHVLGIDLGLAPYQKGTRAFGFLKGREGEDGYWYCNYPETRTAPIDLSLLSWDDPRIEVMERPAARNNSRDSNQPPRNPNMLDFMR